MNECMQLINYVVRYSLRRLLLTALITHTLGYSCSWLLMQLVTHTVGGGPAWPEGCHELEDVGQ